jgi:hypothetical protein
MEENLNIFSNGRTHPFLFKWNVTICNMVALSFFLRTASKTSYSWT